MVAVKFEMREIVFATSNEGKLKEARELAEEFGISLLSPYEASLHGGIPPEVEETGATYEENAYIKAAAVCAWCGKKPTVADDAGLEVFALGGAPGIKSARYAEGESLSNIEKLLSALKDVSDRRAKFVATLCYLDSSDTPHFVTKEIFGAISDKPSGKGGFGYDPIFIVDGYGETLATLKARGVQVETHRIAAFRSMFSQLARGQPQISGKS